MNCNESIERRGCGHEMFLKAQFAVGNGLPCLGGSFVRYVRSFAIAFSGHRCKSTTLHTSDLQSEIDREIAFSRQQDW